MKNILLFFTLFSALVAARQNSTDLLRTKNYSLTDFGAKGDGTSDDSSAFLKALETVGKTNSKKLIIPNDYIFNLGNKTIDFSKVSSGIILDFDGGYFKNGTFIGNKTKIKAERIKIFENIKLSGTFFSSTDFAYPEWYGIFPNDNTLDVVDALKQLDPVFFDISLGTGDYYTNKGEYQVKGLQGTSMASSRLIMETDKSNTYLLSMGKIGGTVKERTYNYNYVKNLSLFITKKNSNSKLKSNKGIIIGAVHKPLIENVRIQQALDYQKFSKSDLYDFTKDEKKVSEANVGIEFNGDSEVIRLTNIFTLSDVGIMFSKYTDFVSVTDFMSWCGKFGLANVYFKKEAVKSQNLLFTGSQSWNEGLYGFYSEDSNEWNTFRNNKFENVRIEQLTSEILKDGKVVSTSIRIGKSNLIAQLMFENVILSGASNGIEIGETTSGDIYFDNVILYPDVTVKRAFAVKSKFLKPSTSKYENPFRMHLKNINLYNDSDSYFENAKTINKKETLSNQEKNVFSDEVISY